MIVKSGLESILKFTEPLQSCCCPVQKYLPRMAELAWQLSRYLWRGLVHFKINSRPLLPSFVSSKNLKTRDFSPLIERVLAGVMYDLLEYHYEVYLLSLFRKSQKVICISIMFLACASAEQAQRPINFCRRCCLLVLSAIYSKSLL